MLNLLLSRYHEIKGDSAASGPHMKGGSAETSGCEPFVFPHLPSPPVAKLISTALTVSKDEDWAMAASRLLKVAGTEANQAEVNALVQRIDLDELVRQADLGAILAESSGGLASEALDGARSEAAGIDQAIDRWVWRLLRRRPRPVAPPALADPRTQP